MVTIINEGRKEITNCGILPLVQCSQGDEFNHIATIRRMTVDYAISAGVLYFLGGL